MTNGKVVLTVVIGLVVLAVGSLAGIVLLAVLEKSVPDVMQNVAIGAMTAVAGILARTGTEPTEVRVVDEPLEVTETPAPKPARRRS